MCRLIGYAGQSAEGAWGETFAVIEAMFLAAEAGRNVDAAGFAALTSPYKNPLAGTDLMDKAGIPATEFVRSSGAWRGLRHRRCSIVIAHARLASHGSPKDNRNNHPFVSEDGSLYLIHNGVLRTHRDIAKRHGLRLRTDCDSEALLRLVESFSSPLQGLRACLDEVEGSMAVAILDARREALWFARNAGNPLWLCKLEDKRWFFASTDGLLLGALKEVLGDRATDHIQLLMPLAEGHVHFLSPITQRLIAVR